MEIYFEFKEIKEQLAEIKELLNEDRSVNDDKKLYTLKELEDVLNVKSRTIHSYLKEGKLKGSKYGNKIWVTGEQIKDFLNAHRNNPL